MYRVRISIFFNPIRRLKLNRRANGPSLIKLEYAFIIRTMIPGNLIVALNYCAPRWAFNLFLCSHTQTERDRDVVNTTEYFSFRSVILYIYIYIFILFNIIEVVQYHIRLSI